MPVSTNDFVAGTPKRPLRDQLAQGNIVVAPGVYDALGALMAERAGFSICYLSGASIAYTRFGRSDIGLVSMSEVAAVLSAISERVALPVVVDADTGFGNAINVMRTVRLFEQCGAEAIQLEDQSMPKRCGHLAGKTLVSTAEMVGKLKAALDARRNDRCLIIARTDAIAVEGFDAAMERAERYIEAGADMLFVEALRSEAEMRTATSRFAGRVPLMANMVEGGVTPIKDAVALQKLGFRFVIFPGGLVRAFSHMAEQYFASLREHGSTMPFASRMLDFDGMNRLLGTPDLLALGRRYDAANFGGSS
jgi:2-methylisocitrate lyase-like PEP mutase family enzyme